MGSIQGRCEHPCQPQYCRSSFFKLRYRNLIGLVKCFGGGFISDAVGDGLVSAGVNLQSMYGTTETGPISRYGTPPGSDWAWIEIWHKMSIEWFDQGNGTYECHYLVCEVRLLWKFTLQHAHRKENCTSLRFSIEMIRKVWSFRICSSSIRRRTICGRCTIIPLLIYEILTLSRSVCRKDDVIIHSSEIKTLPGPVEEIINSSPL